MINATTSTNHEHGGFRPPNLFQVFDKALVWFSIGGEYYVNEPVNYVYMADTILKEPRNVSIRLNRQIGQFVKLQLFFANVWISVSEIAFDSELAEGRYLPEQEPFEIPHETPAEEKSEPEMSTDATLTQGECPHETRPAHLSHFSREREMVLREFAKKMYLSLAKLEHNLSKN